jgi:hypothetical protein
MLEQPVASVAFALRFPVRQSQLPALRVPANYRPERFTLDGRLEATTPDQSPLALHIPVLEELTIQVRETVIRLWIEQLRANESVNGLCRQRVRLGALQTSSQLVILAFESPLEFGPRYQMRLHVGESTPLIIVHKKLHCVVLPGSIRRKTPQPILQERPDRIRSIQQWQARLYSDRTEIGVVSRQINS